MSKIILRAVGDNLIHKQLYEAARSGDGTYDFTGMYEHVRPLLEEADIAVINQETILVTDDAKVSSFPAFGSPTAVGEAILDAGFDVVTHASNHALDKGYEAISDSVNFWEGHKDRIRYAGIHTSAKDQSDIRILERKGIKVAILNYTEPLNFHRIPSSHPYCVDVMKFYTKDRIRDQIKKAKVLADIVIVFPHWGCEYLYEPVKKQKKWAAFFANAGADLIIGTHPHVLQHTTKITTKDGRIVPCLYSLGNFISCQINQGTMLGGMADIRIEKSAEGVAVTSADIIPLVTHTDDSYSYFTTYPLSAYTDELAAKNKIFAVMERNLGVHIDVAYLKKLYLDIRRKQAMKDSIYKTPTDVLLHNIAGVYNAMIGKNTKE